MQPEAARARAARDLAFGLSLLLLVLAVALPPEIDPWSRAGCRLSAAAAAWILGVMRPAGPRRLPLWSLLLLPFAAASILSAACRTRAIDEAVDALTLLIAALLGASQAGEGRRRDLLAALLVVLASGAALRAVLQHHVTYPRQADALRAAAPPEAAGALVRLRSGRPSGPFSLPAALGGFLALALPIALAGAARGARPGVRAAALAAALLLAYALALTRSIGALASVTVAGLLMTPFLAPRRRGAAAILILALAGGGALVALRARRAEITGPASFLSLALRAGNWGAAARMVRDHPLFGVGPGSFEVFYPRYMRPGMNETRYAHCSYLQALACWGIWIAMPLAALLLAFARAVRTAWPRGDPRLALLAGGGAFLVHNLVDFTAFLPGVAIPSALVLGLGIGASAGDVGHERGRASPGGILAASALALLGLALGAHALAASGCRIRLERAIEAARRSDPEGAAARAREAAAARPTDPDPHAFLAQLVLDRWMDDPRLRAEGEASAERALRLDPESAILHYTRALFYRAAGESAAAYREIYAAHLLYPLKAAYDPGAVSEPGR